jgi:hypothetical protein
MLDGLQLNRKNLSSYYITLLAIKPLLEIVSGPLQSLSVLLLDAFSLNGNSQGSQWWVVAGIVLLLILVFRQFIIQPLGLYVRKEGAPAWELAVLTVMLLGLLCLQINNIFQLPMADWLPNWSLRAVDGAKYSLPNGQEIWGWLSFLWYFGPLALLYYQTKVYINTHEDDE